MSDENDFQDLIVRVRAGDNEACDELIRRYGDALLRTARVRLLRNNLQRLFNPSDVLQSVMLVFFKEVADGAYKLASPEDLLKLLNTMVRRKVTRHRRWIEAVIRGGGKKVGGDAVGAPDPGPSPSAKAAADELFEKIWASLDSEDRQLMQLRLWEELPWKDVAVRLDTTAEAARKRFNRACDAALERWGEGEGYG